MISDTSFSTIVGLLNNFSFAFKPFKNNEKDWHKYVYARQQGFYHEIRILFFL